MKKFFIFLVSLLGVAYSCTGISFKTQDGGFLHARTIEYGEGDLHSKLIISPKNHKYVSLLPNTKDTGIKWTAKYGFVGISVMDDRFIAEGINEKGLNAGLFYFPHYGSLARYNPKLKSKSLVDMQIIAYILSNFQSVDEVKQALKSINIVNIGYDNNNNPLPTAHYRIADSSGANVVLEIVENGKINFYDNKVGVLTNSPDYTWHVKNLNNYINLTSGNAANFSLNDEKFFSFGAGTGALGLPGDITPPSRFVRAFYMLNTMPKIQTTTNGVKSAFHILNNFDIPIWVEYPKQHHEYIPKELLTATQWTSVSELKNKHFYYKTMHNENIRKIDLSKINFSKIKLQSLPLDGDVGFSELKIK